MYRSTAQDLGAAFRPGGNFAPVDMRKVGMRSAGSTRTANRYEGTACPPGQTVVSRTSEPRSPKFIGDKTSTDVVFCKPIPAAAPAAPAPAPNINVQTTVSPTLQTQISPQISPVFSQMQDSPGSTQAATTAQVQPTDMTAKPGGTGGGGDNALLEYMRFQAEQDAQRRAEETAQREADRRRREDEDRRWREQQSAAQADAQRRADADRAEQLRLQQAAEQQRAAEQAERDRQWQEAQAAQQAAYEAALEQTPAATPSTFVATPAVMPGREMVGFEEPVPLTAPVEAQATGPNWPLIIGGVVIAGGAAYVLTRKKGKRK